MKNTKFMKMVAGAMLAIMMATPTFATNVFINETIVINEYEPLNVNGSVCLAVRPMSKLLNFTVTTDGKQVSISKGKEQVLLSIGQKQAIVNGKSVTLPTAPFLKNGTVYVPASSFKYLGVVFTYKEGNLYFLNESFNNIKTPTADSKFKVEKETLPKSFYELPFTKGAYIIYPKDMDTQGGALFTEENKVLWGKRVSENLQQRLNTSSMEVTKLTQTYIGSTTADDLMYDRTLNDIKKYQNYLKKSQIKISGSCYVDPDSWYIVDNTYYVRCYLQFKATSPTCKEFKLFENNAQPLETGREYRGTIDIGIGTIDGNSDGTDMGVSEDKISYRQGLKIK